MTLSFLLADCWSPKEYKTVSTKNTNRVANMSMMVILYKYECLQHFRQKKILWICCLWRYSKHELTIPVNKRWDSELAVAVKQGWTEKDISMLDLGIYYKFPYWPPAGQFRYQLDVKFLIQWCLVWQKIIFTEVVCKYIFWPSSSTL